MDEAGVDRPELPRLVLSVGATIGVNIGSDAAIGFMSRWESSADMRRPVGVEVAAAVAVKGLKVCFWWRCSCRWCCSSAMASAGRRGWSLGVDSVSRKLTNSCENDWKQHGDGC